jgi:phage recombination protein Bet
MNAPVQNSIITTQISQMADILGLGNVDPVELKNTLIATAFNNGDKEISDAQMASLLIVAGQYKLNPWTKEIYAFPDKNKGIIPVVGVDGWSRIINSSDNFDGMEFRYSENMLQMDGAKVPAPEWIECVIYRSDRKFPTVVREYLTECYRAPFKGKYGDVIGPWQSHPSRFLRHKATIQCARLAFGFVGIYDQDEAERIRENNTVKTVRGHDETTSSRLEDTRPALTEKQANSAIKKIKNGEVELQQIIDYYVISDDLLNHIKSQIEVIEHDSV